MKFFCMPSDFKFETIDAYAELNSRYLDSKVEETYGQLAPDSLFGSCRSNAWLPEVDAVKLESYIKYSRDKGIKFNYILNATCMSNDELTIDGYNKIKDFLLSLEGMGVESVTASLPSFMEIIKHVTPGIKIKVSTVSQVNSALKAAFYDKLGISRIVIDEDVNRNFKVLKNIRKAFTGELEVIVNSFCLTSCPYRMFHYNYISHTHEGKASYQYYSNRCRSQHIKAENYIKLNWIRPEDIKYYIETGINYFKLQGRTNVHAGKPVKAVEAYMKETYDGDLLELLELFAPDRPLSIGDVKVDNRRLDGFINKFVQEEGACTQLCLECGYCKAYSEYSISSSDITMLEFINAIDSVMSKQFLSYLDSK